MNKILKAQLADHFDVADVEVEFVEVSPALARAYLNLNTENRYVRKSHVASLRQAFGRGEYYLTTDAIGFTKEGTLLNGQHRLEAIGGMPDSFRPVMLVIRGLDKRAFKVIDSGVKRNLKDAVREEQKELLQMISVGIKIIQNRESKLSPQYICRFLPIFREVYQDIDKYCGRKLTKTWSSSPMRLAVATLILLGGDQDYILSQFKALLFEDFPAMTSTTQALFRSRSKISERPIELFASCMKALGAEKRDMQKFHKPDPTEYVKLLENLMSPYMD